ncbi:glutamine amidotransferase [Allochromatium palmeri]|uniref:Glutamine amidotransferase n=1 Tax=Allochromatium palmeri TaxID=231048 RepID=A0A6N8E6C2_9GAMM|nr:glutamine amidotransferase [Allochromatium palmeri]MTW19655.1 glutamine amidotransferase [Allochromatium palmeri]
MKTVVAIRHVAFEDLGSFASVLAQRGFSLRYLEAGVDQLDDLDPSEPDVLVVLGGPIGAYEESNYPFIRDELRLLEKRLQADRPTLGICLGAQLMARALGARVYPGPRKEIGWMPLHLSPEGQVVPLAHVDGALTSMLHWHGDTFDLPAGATRLASTDLYPNQAFSWGRSALALQCHPEVRAGQLERWLIGHASELAGAGISIPDLRAESARLAPTLEQQGQRFFDAWLTAVDAHP